PTESRGERDRREQALVAEELELGREGARDLLRVRRRLERLVHPALERRARRVPDEDAAPRRHPPRHDPHGVHGAPSDPRATAVLSADALPRRFAARSKWRPLVAPK